MTHPVTEAGHLAGIKAAAAVIEDYVWKQAREMVTKTGTAKKIPPTVRSYVRMGIGYVAAGGRGGRAAPNAAMFETPGARHPLFGNKKHWYEQPYRPFMEEGAERGASEAADVYADVTIGIWLKETGWK